MSKVFTISSGKFKFVVKRLNSIMIFYKSFTMQLLELDLTFNI